MTMMMRRHRCRETLFLLLLRSLTAAAAPRSSRQQNRTTNPQFHPHHWHSTFQGTQHSNEAASAADAVSESLANTPATTGMPPVSAFTHKHTTIRRGPWQTSFQQSTVTTTSVTQQSHQGTCPQNQCSNPMTPASDSTPPGVLPAHVDNWSSMTG